MQQITNNNGKQYEEFISFVYQLAHKDYFKDIHLQLNKKINQREFDIYWEENKDGKKISYAIECKDYKNKVNIEKIDAFVTKTKDNNINKGLFVCKNGFQQGCYDVAKKHGIDLKNPTINYIKDIKN
jgi:hypothetical protein